MAATRKAKGRHGAELFAESFVKVLELAVLAGVVLLAWKEAEAQTVSSGFWELLKIAGGGMALVLLGHHIKDAIQFFGSGL